MVVVRRTCCLCGLKTNIHTMKQSWPSKNRNIVMMALLSLKGVVDKADVDIVVERLSKNGRVACQSHVIEAAQYLCAELAANGSRLSYHKSPKGRKIAHVNLLDISSSQIVYVINGMTNDNVIITAKDVWEFLNIALKSYPNAPIWPEQTGTAKGTLREFAPNWRKEKSSAPIVPATGREINVIQVPYLKPAKNSSCNPLRTLYRVGETDEADLQRYYLVQGTLLMTLFRFCPECGERLEGTQLKPVGTAAVVQFECGRCSRSMPVQKWTSQERVVDHSRERMFKGNVVAAVSAVTAGLKLEDLVRWAKLLNLAMFSETFFYKVSEWTNSAMKTIYDTEKHLVTETDDTSTHKNVEDGSEENPQNHLVTELGGDTTTHNGTEDGTEGNAQSHHVTESGDASAHMDAEDGGMEIDGEKAMMEECELPEKFLNKKLKPVLKTNPIHLLGDLILAEVFKERLTAWEEKATSSGAEQ